MRHDVAVVGAGPYGLAAASHLRDGGSDVATFGEPLAFWRRRMPAGMMLRSSPRASSIADPRRSLGIGAWARARGRSRPGRLSLDDFLDYGEWFRSRAVGEVDRRFVRLLESGPGGFVLHLDDGEAVRAGRVAVAAGLEPFPRRPEAFAGLPRRLVSHSSDGLALDALCGRPVLVIGGGQSAIETAALASEAGARVEVVVRAPEVRWLGSPSRRSRLRARLAPPTGVGGVVSGWAAATPTLVRRLPDRLRSRLDSRCRRPAAAGWLRPRTRRVAVTNGAAVRDAEALPAGDGVRVRLDDGTHREVAHVLLATGFAVDVARYDFLEEALRSRLRTAAGSPLLGPGLESSVPGLHFLGAAAAHTYGPIMHFIVGTWYAAPALARRVGTGGHGPRLFSFA